MMCVYWIHAFTIGFLLGTVFPAQYVEFTPGTGNLPLVLSAPHGGWEKPSAFPVREAGCWDGNQCVYSDSCGTKDSSRCSVTTTRDMYTNYVAKELREALCKIHGACPALILSTLHRSRLDPNREVGEAAGGHVAAITEYNAYHKSLKDATAAIGGPGLVLDLHGHGHSIQRDELGYLVSGSTLNNGTPDPNTTSIRSLAERHSHYSFENVLRGTYSFGWYLRGQGVPSVPSPDNPGPGSSTYFSGGYITKEYGSRDGGLVDAIQIEAPRDHRYLPGRTTYVNDLARAITSYLRKYYSAPIPCCLRLRDDV